MFFVLGVRACVIIGVKGFGNQGFCFSNLGIRVRGLGALLKPVSKLLASPFLSPIAVP